MTGRVVGWPRATGLLLAWVVLVSLFAAPALADTTFGAPRPVAGSDVLYGVACTSATSCLAVGTNASKVGVVVPVTNGIPRAATTIAGIDDLSGVACTSATTCLAVGRNDFLEGVVVPVTNGIPGAATPVAGTDLLNGVACSSATSCLASGSTTSSEVGAVVAIANDAPGVSGYRLTNNPFVVAGGSTPKSGSAAKTKKLKKGTTFRYALSKAATVKIVIAQRHSGRRKHKKCVAPTHKLRHARKCTRITTRGTLTRVSRHGVNRVAFSGRSDQRRLGPAAIRPR